MKYRGPGGIRTCGLFSAIEVDRSSTESTAYIWLYNIHHILTCGGMGVQNVYYFHAVFLALHTVAHGMKKEMQPAALSIGEDQCNLGFL